MVAMNEERTRENCGADMLCPKCRASLSPQQDYYTGEDEGSGDALYTYHEWHCPACDHTIRDWDDEFRYVENGVVVDD